VSAVPPPHPEPPPPGGGPPRPPEDPLGRAHSFRAAQTQRRSAQRERLGVFLVVAILAAALVTVATIHPFSAGYSYHPPPAGPTIVVHLGTPTVSTLTCGDGGTAYAEHIPWTGATSSVSSGEMYVRPYEIGDGDIIADPGAVANATPTNACAGPPPNAQSLWYVVLAAPTGGNTLTYTMDNGWTSIGGGSANQPIENASVLTLVTYASMAGTGRGFGVYGVVNATDISGSVVL
jgi:hypothetical protein